MLDSKLLRTELDETAAKLARRGFNLDVKTLRNLEEQRKSLQVKTEELQAQRNSRSKSIGQAKAGDHAEAERIMAEVGNLGSELDEAKTALVELQGQLILSLKCYQTLLMSQYQQVKMSQKTWKFYVGVSQKAYDFEVKDHVDLGEMAGGLDFASAVKLLAHVSS